MEKETMMNSKKQLKVWEQRFRGHEDLLTEDWREIKRISEDPMLQHLTADQKSELESKLVNMVIQIA